MKNGFLIIFIVTMMIVRIVLDVKLEINQHNTYGYSDRTKYNIRKADTTIAFAIDFNTAGEKLTRSCSLKEHKQYIPISLLVGTPEESGSAIISGWKTYSTINIAGNGIHTLVKYGWTQEKINQYVYKTLKYIHNILKIYRIVSGGQTGADIAGIVAAYALDIPATITFPKGFVQRNIKGEDVTRNSIYIEQEIKTWATLL